ncbi:pyocin knob domain-containing protein [Anaerosolibacter sp.]|uniref:pyocin knob domain-containing protein n=1 Tax=Anaerosolibacter sp. TaxID=1872527 RepID=UPI0039EFB03E
METMYPAQINSPATTLLNNITDTDTEITVVDGAVLPAAPNLCTFGSGSDAETVLYTGKTGSTLTCIRGFQGTAKNWTAGSRVARNFTAYDHDKFKANIEDLDQRQTLHSAETLKHVQILATNAFNFADAGTLYPVGISLFQFNSSAIGFPTAGGQCLTFKTNDDRMSQIITETNVTTPKMWTREYRVSNSSWSDALLNINQTTGDARYARRAESNQAPNNNLNDIVATGFYSVDSATTNTPGLGGSGSTVITSTYNVDNQEQIYLGRTGNLVFYRRKNAGNWQPWIEFITTEHIRSGSGSPEGVVTAPVGTLYRRTDGGVGTTFYVKESGTGNTGWVAK